MPAEKGQFALKARSQRLAGILHDIWWAGGYRGRALVMVNNRSMPMATLEPAIRLLRRRGLSVRKVVLRDLQKADRQGVQEVRGWRNRQGARYLAICWKRRAAALRLTAARPAA